MAVLLLGIGGLTMLLGAAMSAPLLNWGRRLDGRRLRAIEGRLLLRIAIGAVLLLLALVSHRLLEFCPPLILFGPMVAFIVVAYLQVTWKSDPDCWRAPLYTLTVFVLLILLLDLERRL